MGCAVQPARLQSPRAEFLMMATTPFSELLSNSFSADANLRVSATAALEAASRDSYPQYMGALVQELSSEQTDVTIRTAAGIALKNQFTAKDARTYDQLVAKWTSLDATLQGQIKHILLVTLGSPERRAGHTSAQVIAAIANIDLPRGQWSDLINNLLSFVATAGADTNKKISSLEAIGFVCETINPDVLQSQSNAILTAIAQGAHKNEPNEDVRLAAMNALLNALDFVRENFEKESERNYLMQIVCESTQSTYDKVQVVAFECLVKIVNTYYDKMQLYMQQALIGLTLNGMKHENENIALQAIEFWSSVCEVEWSIMYENDLDYEDPSDEIKRHNFGFGAQATPQLVPILLFLMTKKDEDDDEDEWNVSMAASTCLSQLALNAGDLIVSPVIPFVEAHITSNDWCYRDAAVMAFGSIVDGPRPEMISPLALSALPILIRLVKEDPSVQVRDSAGWALGRILEALSDSISANPANIQQIAESLMVGLNSNESRVSASCAWSLIMLAETNQRSPEDPTYVLSSFFEPLINGLVAVGERPGVDSNLRASVYEALSNFVEHCPADCEESVKNLTTGILGRLQITLGMQTSNDANALQPHEMQSHLCNTLTACVRRLGNGVRPIADSIMQLMLQIGSQTKISSVIEDIFFTAGAVSVAIEADFIRYMDHLTPLILSALSNVEDVSVCRFAIGLIGDAARALGQQLTPYVAAIMTALLSALQNDHLDRDIKPEILSLFGDLAMEVPLAVEPYLSHILQFLSLAYQSCIHIDGNDYDYLAGLRNSILESFTGILHGLKATDKAALMLPQMPQLFAFVQSIYEDPSRGVDVTKTIIGFLGDIASAYPGKECAALFQQHHTWIDSLLRLSKAEKGIQGMREVVRYTKEALRSAQ
ncbi:karyopherin Kap95 [Polychytrium aggregatum]|uniref:karyopherin Kap95 n=1 Tax=Polychytrium aggregatum TaxID=110093 RepID=UPI0022FDF58E|nr:karyopherin Kap95 [Polychytrium aggregatum]KAI9203949.1 karyopherin Kap95 [Polychytrium aggregatum]